MGSVERSDFGAAVVAVVAGLPPGEVVTYGEVAAEAGRPGAARAVGRVLRDAEVPLPWWRVVTATGRLVPGLEEEHARRLAAEGVATRDGRVVGSRGSARRSTPPGPATGVRPQGGGAAAGQR
ncbi:MGMT family protein [Egicoccus sp. AB-alg2]|uniref:MGMT family protein n=1 Tax=Egicoccus sp. AB-alg2 TaxID=3242693 RepID=UPI00359CFCBC